MNWKNEKAIQKPCQKYELKYTTAVNKAYIFFTIKDANRRQFNFQLFLGFVWNPNWFRTQANFTNICSIVTCGIYKHPECLNLNQDANTNSCRSSLHPNNLLFSIPYLECLLSLHSPFSPVTCHVICLLGSIDKTWNWKENILFFICFSWLNGVLHLAPLFFMCMCN